MTYKNLDKLCMGCFSELQTTGGFCPVCGYDQTSQIESPYQLAPRTILCGKYMIGRVLGEGGFGITYIGYDLNLDIKIAVKEYYPTGFVTRANTSSTTVQPFGGEQGEVFFKGRDRFVDEAKRLARFRTLPGIVMANDFFIENGTAYIVMEYVEGQTLKSYLNQLGGAIPAQQVLEMMRPVFMSLAQVHESGLIHRDISPDNIMMAKDGSVKLLDFGAAREFGANDEKSLSVLLKHGYAPTEQYSTKGVQGPHTDVYALSATIYKAITGITPESSMDRILEDNLQPPSKYGIPLSPPQEAALMKAFALRREERFQTVTEFYNALYGAGVQWQDPMSVPGGYTTAPPAAVPVQPTGYTTAPPAALPVQPTGYTAAPGAAVPVQPTGYTTAPPDQTSYLHGPGANVGAPKPVNANKKIVIPIVAGAAALILIIALIASSMSGGDGGVPVNPDRQPAPVAVAPPEDPVTDANEVVIIPNVELKTFDDILIEYFDNVFFTFTPTNFIESAEYPAGTILFQDPPADSFATFSNNKIDISLTISIGAPMAEPEYEPEMEWRLEFEDVHPYREVERLYVDGIATNEIIYTGQVRELTLDEAIIDTNDWVRLTARWPNGAMTVFERDKDSDLWVMQSRDGNTRLVDPVFNRVSGGMTIEFPTTSSKYNLYDDFTGNLGSESLTWSFDTHHEASLGGASGNHLKTGLENVWYSYPIVVIRMYWSNGDSVIFYRDNTWFWRYKGRSGGLSSLDVYAYFTNEYTYLETSEQPNPFMLYEGGSGTYGNENITWEYGYFSY